MIYTPSSASLPRCTCHCRPAMVGLMDTARTARGHYDYRQRKVLGYVMTVINAQYLSQNGHGQRVFPTPLLGRRLVQAMATVQANTNYGRLARARWTSRACGMHALRWASCKSYKRLRCRVTCDALQKKKNKLNEPTLDGQRK